MKIGFHTQYYPPEMGAPQARLSELAQVFANRGHEVYILTAVPNYPTGRVYAGHSRIYETVRQSGINIFRTYVHPTKSSRLLPRITCYLSFAMSSSVVGAARLPELDFILTESPPLFLGPTGYFLSVVKRARWIFNVSDLWPQSAIDLGFVQDGFMLDVAYALERFCYRRAWTVTGQSKEILASITERFPDVRTYHLSNGVDVGTFRQKHVHASNGFCTFFYGGLHGLAQGLDQVLSAAEHVRDSAIRFLLVGDGPEKESLIRMTRERGIENVEFQDPVSRQDMPALLEQADVAIVPLKKRIRGAVPSKLYEAMAVGLPVLLIADGEAASIVKASGAGHVVQPGDIRGLVDAIRELAYSAEKRREMGVCGRRAAELSFSRASIASNFVHFLEDSVRK